MENADSIKVLHFYRTYMPASYGGVEEAIRQLCLAGQVHGIDSRVLTLAQVPKTEELQLPEALVIRAPLQWEPASCSMGIDLFRLYRQQAKWADVIHIHYPWPFADLVHLISGVKKPVVVTYHSDIVRQGQLEKLYSPLRRCFFNRVQAVVATSPNYRDSSPFLASVKDKCSVIPLGLCPDSSAVAEQALVEQVKQQYGEFFLFVGVLRYYKGLSTLIAAAKHSQSTIVIAGKGPEEQQLKQQAAELGVDNVVFLGFVSDELKAALYQACKAVVFPSCVRSEAFGVTLLEGLLYGKPLISCEIGTGTSYVNEDGVTGLVIPPNDASALAAAMRKLDSDHGLVKRMGEAGTKRLKTFFSADSVACEYARLYQQLVD